MPGAKVLANTTKKVIDAAVLTKQAKESYLKRGTAVNCSEK